MSSKLYNITKKSCKYKAFTLIELIIVIAVIAILAGLALPKFMGVRRDAQVAAMYRDISALESVSTIYNSKNDEYPIKEVDNIEFTEEFKETLLSYNDDVEYLYEIDLNKLTDYVSDLKYGNNETVDDTYLYSSKTNKVYYLKGINNGEGEKIFTIGTNTKISLDLGVDTFAPDDNLQTNYLKILLKFLDEHMSNEYGVYTNYIDETSDNIDITKGHKILSETQGLTLLYSANSNDKERFDKIYNVIKQNMIMENGLISWRIDKDGTINDTTNALVDDLRIVKGLFYGYKRWGDPKYKNLALKIGNSLKKYCVDDEYIYNFYDSKYDMTSDCIDSSYLDLAAMKLLAKYDSSWIPVINKSKEIISNAYISEDLPLYQKEYYYKTDEYKNMENENGEYVDTLLSTIVVLNKSESGENVDDFLKWANKKLSWEGYIVAAYNFDGTAASSIESSAIYSMVSIIAYQQQDMDLFNKCMNKIKEFQLNDYGWNQTTEEDPLYGGFGNKYTKELYSFDNVYALNALQYLR